jgi:hypothetical protein
MTKKRVPDVLIDDHLLILGELNRQGLLDHPTTSQPKAAHLSKGGDDERQGKPEPGTT